MWGLVYEITQIKGRANTFMRDFLAAQNPQHRPNTKSISAVRWIPPIFPLLMYIVLWALGPLGPITLLVQHTYTCTALYLYRTLRPPI